MLPQARHNSLQTGPGWIFSCCVYGSPRLWSSQCEQMRAGAESAAHVVDSCTSGGSALSTVILSSRPLSSLSRHLGRESAQLMLRPSKRPVPLATAAQAHANCRHLEARAAPCAFQWWHARERVDGDQNLALLETAAGYRCNSLLHTS